MTGRRRAAAKARHALAHAKRRDGGRLASDAREEPLFFAREPSPRLLDRRATPLGRHLEPIGQRGEILLEVRRRHALDRDVSWWRRELARRKAVQNRLLEVELREAGGRQRGADGVSEP